MSKTHPIIYFDRALLTSQDAAFSVEIYNVTAEWTAIEWQNWITGEQMQELGTPLKLIGLASRVFSAFLDDQASNFKLTYNRLILTTPNRAIAVMQEGELRPYDLLIVDTESQPQNP